eukprot:CAMPEP_0113887304 /NCGR_PEP_ID=MMETSP0780_2-20120614/12128_1 /TAXON_ID=652834 /ORGANISM="Palpitomonas bilix" /LENGTH=112 /DNA_ID=CAMNT_0000875799 /DNA_START=259 /DNA_END=597 /DNA_ORIENTATION=+ /assembly_acc=CAM_ASM_000599
MMKKRKVVKEDFEEAKEVTEADPDYREEELGEEEDEKPKIQTNENREQYMDLGSSKRITMRSFKNIPLVDIREYYSKDGKMLPGKKGISLTKAQFMEIYNNIEEIKKELDKL